MANKRTSAPKKQKKLSAEDEESHIIRRHIIDGQWQETQITGDEAKVFIERGKRRVTVREEQTKPLTDAQWMTIASTIGLPDETRQWVQRTINQYRGFNAQPLTTASELRAKLKMMKNASAFLVHQFRFMDDMNLMMALFTQQKLDYPTAMHWSEQLYCLCRDAYKSIPRVQRTTLRKDRIYQLIEGLGGISLHFTGKKLSVAKKGKKCILHYLLSVIDVINLGQKELRLNLSEATLIDYIQDCIDKQKRKV